MGVAKKRGEALVTLATAGTVNGTPTPSMETAKQLVVATIDGVLCLRLGKIYFEDDFGMWDLWKALRAGGGVVGLGGLATYGAVKLVDGLAAEAFNFGGPPGWALSAATAATATFAVRTAFWWACDRARRNGTDVGDELAESDANWSQYCVARVAAKMSQTRSSILACDNDSS